MTPHPMGQSDADPFSKGSQPNCANYTVYSRGPQERMGAVASDIPRSVSPPVVIVAARAMICYNDRTMDNIRRSLSGRFGRDRIFWYIVGGLVLLFALLQVRSMLGLAASLIGLLIAITIHECAHAWTADRLGDPTARYLGRISLNPLVHLDPLGTLMMVLTALTGVGVGWGKPVPVSPHRLRYGARLGNGLVALSGPASNLLLALVLGLALRLTVGFAPVSWFSTSSAPLIALISILDGVVVTNIVIAFFNLLPLPPLDGYSVLLGLLSLTRSQWAWRTIQFLDGLQRHGMLILFGFIIVSQFLGLNLFGRLIGAPAGFLYRLIMGRYW